MRTSGRRSPLFLVHAIGGNVLNYQPLDRHLPADLPLYALQAPGLKEKRAKAMSIEEMARSYVAAVRSVQPTGPYRFGGYSAGGVLAFEMAQQLTEAGETVSNLFLFDSSVEPSAASSLRAGRFKAAAWRTWRTIWWNLHYMARTDLRFFASRKAQNFWLNLKVLLYQTQGLLRRAPGLVRSTSLLTVEQGFVHALERYTPKPYAGTAVLFRTRESDFYNPDATLGWSRLMQGGLDVVNAEGDHDTMFAEPHIEGLSLRIAEYLSGSGTCRPRIDLAPESSLAGESPQGTSSRVFGSA
jgi:thioesterase domain-containing protein